MTRNAFGPIGVVCLLTACGGSGPPADTPHETPATAPQTAPATSVADAGAGGAATSAAAASATPPPAAGETASVPPSSDDTKPRSVSYRVTSTGLVIEVEGVELEPKAEPTQVKGGWGMKVSVRAASKDGREHRLLASLNGPLMVAREVDRGGGKQEKTGDERKNAQEEVVPSTGSTHFERDFRDPIVKGQSLTLSVGLWGLENEKGDRRPVRKLFIVKMVVGSKKPIPVITPPE